MDSSSELVHSLLPVFMVSTLGASMVTVGVVEGVAEATASVTKVFSGTFSDWLRRRKLPTLVGYGLAALSKPLFPLASTIGWVFAGRFVDRVGKGIRGAPRDALIADAAPEGMRGAAFGLRQALDSVGAFLGPLLAVALMAWLSDDLRTVLWVAVVPAVLAVVVLAVAVREPEAPPSLPRLRNPLDLGAARGLPAAYWAVVGVGFVFGLARFSEAFLVLRAQSVGLGAGSVPVVLVVMNVAFAATAYPAGEAADRRSPAALLLAGLGALVLADVMLATAGGLPLVLLGAAAWGVHMGLTQGLLAKLVADRSPTALRGTAFGLFHVATGLALLAASVIGGLLWDRAGASATFLAGAGFALVAALGLAVLRGPRRPVGDG
jgi:MFS family permease